MECLKHTVGKVVELQIVLGKNVYYAILGYINIHVTAQLILLTFYEEIDIQNIS